VREVVIEFINVGPTPLCNITAASTHPDFLTFGSRSSKLTQGSVSERHSSSWPTSIYPVVDTTSDVESVITHPSDCGYVYSGFSSTAVEPGETLRLPAWVRGPDEAGEHSIDFLFCYEPTNTVPHVRCV